MVRRAWATFAAALLIFLPQTARAAPDTNPLAAAGSAVVIEASSGRVLLEKDMHRPMAVASTTKIMTAILALEAGNLDDPFVVDADAIRVEGSSMGLTEGDTVTLRALAWGMLLASGNDAANAAAVRMAGSVAGFCERMNERAAALGMTDTQFFSPSGLDVGDHRSTAYDMAVLTRYALSNDLFGQMVRAKSAELYYGNPPYRRRLTNHNRMLWQYDDCIGVKTGYTKKAGRCLVTAAERDGLTLIAVTLDCADDFAVHQAVYERLFATMSFRDLSGELEHLSVLVTGSTRPRVPIRALGPLGAYLTEAEQLHCRLSLDIEPFLYAPVRRGQVVGEAALCVGQTRVSVTPLVAVSDSPVRPGVMQGIFSGIRDFLFLKQRQEDQSENP
jgi:D-alanyl-D-alanine carboxypeptidase (penicillin-binding protein 5/6)